MTKTAPNPNEVEISLFGPGVGECLVVHAGGGNWIVVDSCLNAARDEPIALEYLDGLDVDVSTHVKLVVATHWHDDHTQGLSQVLRAAHAARFACSSALLTEEFCELLETRASTKLVAHSSGVSEFSEIMQILDARLGTPRRRSGPDHWASDGTLLYSQKTPFEADFTAVSPSAQAVTDAKLKLRPLLPTPGTPIGKLPAVAPNDTSVAVVLTTQSLHFLLGADLEAGNDERRGWRAVVTSSVRPQVRSCTYKVAHHGSSNADHPDIWQQLLDESPYAMVTPYARGRKPLPSTADIRRIKRNTSRAYCTVPPGGKRPPRRHKAVDRTMKDVASVRRAIGRQPGHLRLRAPANGDLDSIDITMFDGATRL